MLAISDDVSSRGSSVSGAGVGRGTSDAVSSCGPSSAKYGILAIAYARVGPMT